MKPTGRSRCPALAVTIMTFLALVVPLPQAAVANHGGNVGSIAINPATDSAVVNTCNEFTVTLRGANQNPAEGETVDVRATQSDADTTEDLRIAFCDPDAAGPGTNLGGAADCDDNPEFNVGQGGACAGPGAEAPADIRAEGRTAQNGQLIFGVTSNEPGTMNITVFFETTQNNVLDPNEAVVARATKTWTAGGEPAAANVDCNPETDANPANTGTATAANTHTFTCTVTDAQGAVLPGVTVTFDVTAGPNAEEIAPTACPGQTNAQGQVTCSYLDAAGANSPPGTDTIVGFVNQNTGPTATAGLDPGEPNDQILKTWFGPARFINCDPETATNAPGTQHVVTCIVTDVAGNPVPGQRVIFTETDVGRIVTPAADANGQTTAVTDAAGQVQVVVQTAANETGTQTITGSLSYAGAGTPGNPFQTAAQQPGAQECELAANQPAQGNQAGVCEDAVQKTWAAQPPTSPPPPPRPECDNGIDDDGDGKIDFPADRQCENPEDNSERDIGGRFASTITIRYDADDNAFKGSVASARGGCQRDRRVILKRVRAGRDPVLGRDQTGRFGNYRIRKARAFGRFYTIVRPKRFTTAAGALIVCERDRSPTIRLRRG